MAAVELAFTSAVNEAELASSFAIKSLTRDAVVSPKELIRASCASFCCWSVSLDALTDPDAVPRTACSRASISRLLALLVLFADKAFCRILWRRPLWTAMRLAAVCRSYASIPSR